jgi:hypothetical protein
MNNKAHLAANLCIPHLHNHKRYRNQNHLGIRHRTHKLILHNEKDLRRIHNPHK